MYWIRILDVVVVVIVMRIRILVGMMDRRGKCVAKVTMRTNVWINLMVRDIWVINRELMSGRGDFHT